MATRAEANKARATHGEASRGSWSKTYRAWRYMRDRVARDPGYAHVTICARWSSYTNFKADMGEQPEGKTLDRIDGAFEYGPTTCRWATPVEQANNTSRNARFTFNGQTKTLAQWAKVTGMNPHTLHNRINACGWPVERALTEPHRGWNKQGRTT